jgi:hypothetical protein
MAPVQTTGQSSRRAGAFRELDLAAEDAFKLCRIHAPPSANTSSELRMPLDPIQDRSKRDICSRRRLRAR